MLSILQEHFIIITLSSATQIKASHAGYSSIFDEYFVTVAPRPCFAWLGRNNDGVFGAVIMFGSVFVG